MIIYIRDKVLNYLLKSEAINETDDDIDYYKYGIEIIISSFLNIFWILLIGILFKSLLESMVFLGCFVPLRQFTGGYHAETYFKCNLYLALSFTMILAVFKAFNDYGNLYSDLSMVLFSLIIIISECPVENKNKDLTADQKRRSKSITVIMCLIFSLIAILLRINSIKIGAIIIYTLTLIAILVIVATIKIIRKKRA